MTINATEVESSGTLPNSHAIWARVVENKIDITTTGTVTSRSSAAIKAQHFNPHAPASLIDITATGGVKSNSGDGIHLVFGRESNPGRLGRATVSASRIDSTTGRGVRIDGGGTVSLTISDTISTGGDGVFWDARSHPATLNLGSSTIESSGGRGVHVKSGGNIAITSSGSISGSSAGVYAESTGGGNIVITSSGSISGSNAGVRAKTTTGTARIDITGTASSTSGDAIHLELGSVGTNTVSVSRINSTSGRGVRIVGGGTVTVTSDSISTGGDGVSWTARGDSATLNLGNSTILSTGSKGVDVRSTGGNIQITSSGNIKGSGGGVYAKTSDDGYIRINATGAIEGTGGEGIKAVAGTGASGGTITINAAAVISQNSAGIDASGNVLQVTATETVSGGSHGIKATGNSFVRVAAVDVDSRSNGGVGILASASDTGNVRVIVSGKVRSNGTGIEATGRSIEVNVSGDVESFTQGSLETGIELNLKGSLATLTAANVTAADQGIDITGGGTANINANNVSARQGVKWSGAFSGNASLNIVRGTISGTGGSGVYFNLGGDANVDVDLSSGVTVTGTGNDNAGVGVKSEGTGNVNLDLKGTVTGGSGGKGGAVYVKSKNKVTVKAVRTVTGTVTVDTTVSATDTATSAGIYIDKHGTGNVVVKASRVSSSSFHGIYIHNRNAGDVSVSANGTVAVSESGNSGIVVKNLSSGGGVTVTATDVTFTGASRTVAGDGVYVSNLGRGSVSVSVSGTIRIDGRASTSGSSRGDGIRAKTTSVNTSMNISVGTVSAPRYGVYADHSGNNAFSMSVSGSVTGGTASSNAAIYVKTVAALSASNANIVVNSGASVGNSSSTGAIKSDGGNLTVEFKRSSRLDGTVSLGGGTDNLHVDGSFTSDRLDGGTGVDLLDISGAVGTAKAVSGWETINIESNASVTIQGAITADTAMTLASGSWLSLEDGAANAVTIGTPGQSLGTFAGGGDAVIDVDMVNGKADWFRVNGTLTGSTTLHISQASISADDAALPLQDKILVADISTNATENNFKLAGGDRGFSVDGGRGARYELKFDSRNNKFHLYGQDSCFRQGDPGTGVFKCRGTITAAQILSASGTTDVVGTMEDGTALNVSATVVAITLSQTENESTRETEGGIDFIQEAGGQIVGGSGIVARNEGEGDIAIELNGRVEGTGVAGGSSTLGYGVHASNIDISGGSLSVAVKSSGGVTATSVGIVALNMGSGDTTVESDGSVAGSSAINAKNIGGGKLSVRAGGALTGNTGDGVYAFNSTSGTEIAINASRVRGGRHALHALNRGSAGLSISISGTAAGGASGVVARNWGRGSIEIAATGTVTGEGRADGHAGIDVENMSSSAGQIVITAASVSGGDHGIRAVNKGTGSLEIKATNRIDGKRSGVGVGIRAFNQGTDLSVTAATVSGAVHGVHLTSSGTGNLSFDASGNVTGVTGHGIHADNSSTGGSLSISASGAIVSGGMSAVNASNSGTGGLNVVAGTVTGGSGYAIRALNANGGAVSIAVTGRASGGVTSDDSSAATKPAAIAAFNDASGSGMSITAGSVSGAGFGVWARNEGAGSLSVVATGTVTGSANAGIEAFNAGSSAESSSVLSITAKRVSGATHGIFASHTGGGGVSVEAGAVTGTSGYAVGALNYNGGSVAINVTGSAVGGAVPGTSSAAELAAIAAYNDASGADLKITAVSASGGEFGIWAKNEGTGSVSVVATGKVAGAAKAGIAAFNKGSSSESSSSLSVSVQEVTGATHGIFASHTGGGGISVNAAGTVSGSKGHGIYGFNANGGALTLTAAEAVSGAGTATVNGETVRYDGIRAINSGTATSNIKISAAKTVTGSGHGVRAVNEGSGQIEITASGAVTGAVGHGIYAKNTGESTNASSGVKVTAGTVTGLGAGSHGIFAHNVSGGGLVSIVATGNVTGSGVGGDGIRAMNFDPGTTLNVSVGPLDGGVLEPLTVSGSAHGIHATNSGTGDLTIGAGTVTGADGHGIHAKNTNGGSTEVRVRGAVSGSGGTNDGIHAVNDDAAGVNVEIVVESGGSVSGAGRGIHAHNKGTGHVSVLSTGGRITGAAGHGVFAHNVGSSVNASSVTVSVAAVVTGSGDDSDGIWVLNEMGSGAVSVTAKSDVTGGNAGITVDNSGAGKVVVAASGAVSGATSHGIHAKNAGTAASASSSVVVTAATVTGSSDDGHGIFAQNTAGGGLVSIVATGNVTGGGDGIRA